jgi:hypothetical protein
MGIKDDDKRPKWPENAEKPKAQPGLAAEIPEEDLEKFILAMQCYVPGPVRSSMQQHTNSASSEYMMGSLSTQRQATTLSILLSGFSGVFDRNPEALDWLGQSEDPETGTKSFSPQMLENRTKQVLSIAQYIVAQVQMSVFENEGTVLDIEVLPGALQITAMWGLPPFTHRNDPERAVAAARLCIRVLSEYVYNLKGVEHMDSVLEKIVTEQFTIRCGVATGTVHCGVVGASSRHGYCVTGKAKIVAQELMMEALASQVVVDELTRDLSEHGFQFEELDLISPMRLYREGIILKTDGLAGFLCTNDKADEERDSDLTGDNDGQPTTSFGRWDERGQLRNMVQKLTTRQGGTLVMTGLRGMGAEPLISEISKMGQLSKMNVLMGEKPAVDRTSGSGNGSSLGLMWATRDGGGFEYHRGSSQQLCVEEMVEWKKIYVDIVTMHAKLTGMDDTGKTILSLIPDKYQDSWPLVADMVTETQEELMETQLYKKGYTKCCEAIIQSTTLVVRETRRVKMLLAMVEVRATDHAFFLPKLHCSCPPSHFLRNTATCAVLQWCYSTCAAALTP